MGRAKMIGVLLSALALHAMHTTVAAVSAGRVESDKKALAPLQAYVGAWRGVGQPRQGSSRGAWTEQSEWSWRFDDGRAELAAKLDGSKYFSQLRLQTGDRPGQFVLLAVPRGDDGPSAGGPQRFVGALHAGRLTVTSDDAPDGQPARITVRLVAGGDRIVVLYERRQGTAYARLAEVGSTRKGSSFAKNAATGPECVVTGGLGTIAVEYQGRQYFVCCGGCKELFEDDPAGVLKEYRQRKAEEKSRSNGE